MISSIWRYSHFLLTAVSALFLLLASITGAILALEPATLITQPYAVVDLDNTSLSSTIKALENKYQEVLEIEKTAENFVTASVVTRDNENRQIYVHPKTGVALGNVEKQSVYFNYVTNLHRSLFLKTIGRVFVGVVSFLLCLIAFTGFFLLAQRQGGFKNWFDRVQETNIGQRYHVILGRWFLLPIIIIGTTGVYLSVEKFSLTPETQISHNWNATPTTGLQEFSTSEIPLFKNLKLSEVRKVIFPFSEDVADYYELELRDRELLVHQYTGEVVSEVQYPFAYFVSKWSMLLHTGQGNIFWSVILFIASLSILFFMYSGLRMSIKRIQKTKPIFSTFHKDEAQYILLVGSETGSTYAFAKAYYKALIAVGVKVHLATLNDYNTYKKATHLIVFTATYGDGDAPSNARKFKDLLQKIEPSNNMKFAVVGFGSLRYTHYCEFAIQVNDALSAHPSFSKLQSLEKINEQSPVSFTNWITRWNRLTGMNLEVVLPIISEKEAKFLKFEVVSRSNLNVDETTILRLKSKNKVDFQSGDLLNVIPGKGIKARQYSIARIDADIYLSVKQHTKGVCSHYLSNLETGVNIKASIERNPYFHLPEKASSVYMIANGTGIAPFLGMIINERGNIPIRLLWGGRTLASFDCYEAILNAKLPERNDFKYNLALSQEGKKMYVQDVIKHREKEVGQALKDGCVFMLCGSMAMQHSVLDTLEEIAQKELKQPLSDFENNGQLLTDCY